MGVAASVASGEKQKDPKYKAFLELAAQYESEYKAKLSAGETTDDDMLADFKKRFEAIVNSSEFNETDVGVLSSVSSTSALQALGNDEGKLKERGIHVGDVVKVRDEGFFVEGVVIMIEENMCLVDFGEDDIHELDHPEDKHGKEEESTGPPPAAAEREDSMPRQWFREEDCILVLRGEEFEVGDKVEVKMDGTFLYIVGHIWKIHRKYDAASSSLSQTYDVHFESSNGEAFGARPTMCMEEQIAAYEDLLSTSDAADENRQDELAELDIEYGVKSENMRKIMSGRIKAADRWKSAWRKVNAMIAFKQGARRNHDHPE